MDANSRSVWVPRERMVAECEPLVSQRTTKHDAPDPNCSCGFYALKSVGDEELSFQPGEDVCLGSVYLWGRVIECQNGYRAQYAYPQRITIYGDKFSGVAQAMRERYGVLVDLKEIAPLSFPFDQQWANLYAQYVQQALTAKQASMLSGGTP